MAQLEQEYHPMAKKKNEESKVQKTAKHKAIVPKAASKPAPPSAPARLVGTLRVECVEGPWLDEKCVRYIDVPESASLYDLHLAILNSVRFDEEFAFHFFTALAHDATRKLIPEEADGEIEPNEIDPDAYEEIRVFDYAKPKAKVSLFYALGSDYDDWIFKVQHTGKTAEPVTGEFYPLVLDALAEGPDPEQYGSGFDDFAENADTFRPDMRRSADDDDPFNDDGAEENPFDIGYDDESFFNDDNAEDNSADDFDDNDEDDW